MFNRAPVSPPFRGPDDVAGNAIFWGGVRGNRERERVFVAAVKMGGSILLA